MKIEKLVDVWPLEMPMADALRLGGLPLFVLGHLLISTTRPSVYRHVHTPTHTPTHAYTCVARSLRMDQWRLTAT